MRVMCSRLAGLPTGVRKQHLGRPSRLFPALAIIVIAPRYRPARWAIFDQMFPVGLSVV
jgi:hypothetical protein